MEENAVRFRLVVFGMELSAVELVEAPVMESSVKNDRRNRMNRQLVHLNPDKSNV